MTGSGPLLILEEEENIFEHIQLMAHVGFGLTVTKVVSIASDYTDFLRSAHGTI